MSEFFDRKESDAMIIASLLRTVKSLRSKLTMILHDAQNNLYEVGEEFARPLTPEERDARVAQLQTEISVLQSGNAIATPAPVAPEQPTQDNPTPDAPQIQ
jgi:cob(I)alamin adenosyltransferase